MSPADSIVIRGADVRAVWSTRDGLAVLALADGREVRLDEEAARLAHQSFRGRHTELLGGPGGTGTVHGPHPKGCRCAQSNCDGWVQR